MLLLDTLKNILIYYIIPETEKERMKGPLFCCLKLIVLQH